MRRLRSPLFTPATSPERARNLPSLGADGGFVDLEDAVAPALKVEARQMAREVVDEIVGSAPDFAVYVRVNPVGSEWFEGDIEAALGVGPTGIVVPKIESVDALREARARLDAHNYTGCSIIAGIESGRAVLDARQIIDSGIAAGIYFGADDFATDVGLKRTEDSVEVLYARSHVALVAAVAGVLALDQVVADYNDDARFERDAAFGRSLGYTGKLCVHPRQVPLANAAFSPSPEEIERARRIADAYQAAAEDGVGAITVDGAMVDEPIARRARAVLAAADELD